MADHVENSDPKEESLLHKIAGKIHGEDLSSSSSDSDSDKKPASPSTVKAKIYRLFGREKSVHKVFGGGKPADVLLWRNKKISAAVIGGVTIAWVLFELLDYHLLTLACHISILALAVLFLWSSVSTCIYKRPPHIPEVHLPEDPFLQVASALRIVINFVLAVLREIASGTDLKNKKFLMASRILANLLVMGSGIMARALFQAYRQALANASKTGVAQEAVQNIRRSSKITETEARQILGVTENSSWEEVLQRYNNLFERNAKNGSFYLQSKVHRAKECLETVNETKAQGTTN